MSAAKQFGNLKSESGVGALNKYISSKSYIQGFQFSKADNEVFDALTAAISKDQYPHAWRWYDHIAALKGVSAAPSATSAAPAAANSKVKEAPADDDDVDLFGSEEEDAGEADKLREERLKAYQEKKAKKPGPIAKSSVVLDVKPWDDETDMKVMEEKVRSIVIDGLLWGASKLVPVGYGIHKLQIMCTVEDDKVSIDALQETIQEFEEYVQSVDIAAFNKI